MASVRILTGELDGKRIGYSSETVFHVQVGRYAKGGYKNRYRIVGSLSQAVFWFNGINIGLGYKKRLVMEGAKNPVLARQSS